MGKEKTKVYLYTRVSTNMQIDGYSLDAQKSSMKKQPDRDKMITHLSEIRDYVVANLGSNSQFIKDIDIEIRNQSADFTAKTGYYDDLLKLRAAISWEE